jgi:hypothetical protein
MLEGAILLTQSGQVSISKEIYPAQVRMNRVYVNRALSFIGRNFHVEEDIALKRPRLTECASLAFQKASAL